MKDWVKRLDAFLQFNEGEILKNAGRVTHEVALALAETEFKKYSTVQDKLLESDFDKAVKKLNKGKMWTAFASGQHKQREPGGDKVIASADVATSPALTCPWN